METQTSIKPANHASIIRPRPLPSNGFGLTTSETAREIEKLKQIFVLCPDTPAIFDVWLNLVIKYKVSGKPTHHTRLVAAALVHQMTHVLTFNINDFKRFSEEITAVDPRSVKLVIDS